MNDINKIMMVRNRKERLNVLPLCKAIVSKSVNKKSAPAGMPTFTINGEIDAKATVDRKAVKF